MQFAGHCHCLLYISFSSIGFDKIRNAMEGNSEVGLWNMKRHQTGLRNSVRYVACLDTMDNYVSS
jgi:hypothetical protein